MLDGAVSYVINAIIALCQCGGNEHCGGEWM